MGNLKLPFRIRDREIDRNFLKIQEWSKSVGSGGAEAHTHDYAAISHSHSYAATSHTHDYAASDHTHNILGMTYADAPPTTGSHSRGEILFSNTPSANGYIGWVCVADGTPGTWKVWGFIEDFELVDGGIRFADDFNNRAVIGDRWEILMGTPAIDANELKNTTTNDALLVYKPTGIQVDCSGFVSRASGVVYSGAALRIQDRYNFYYAAQETELKIYKVVGGTKTQLAVTTGSGATCTSLRFECDGTTLNAYKNGASTPTLSVANETTFTQGYCGVFFDLNGTVDNFEISLG